MAEVTPSWEYIGGGNVVLTYVWHGNKLSHSAIDYHNKRNLQGFPKAGHFPVKVTKAVVRTSHNVEALKDGNSCTLIVKKETDAPNITTEDMKLIERVCTMKVADKRKQIKSGQTYPVVIEKVNTNSVFAEPFPKERFITYAYKPHCPDQLDLRPVQERLDDEKQCQTANIVTFSPPTVLFYGPKYAYKLFLNTEQLNLLSLDPIMIINFYGRIYETTHYEYVGFTDNYFSGLALSIRFEGQTDSDSEEEFLKYESGIDDYEDDTSEDEDLEAEKSEEIPAKIDHEHGQEAKSKLMTWVEISSSMAAHSYHRSEPCGNSGVQHNNN